MACSGSHCSEHGTGTESCGNHRASCSTNRAITFTSDAIQGGVIRAADVNKLKNAIRDEVTRYNLHRSFSVTKRQATDYTAGSTLIDNTHVNQMNQMVQDTTNVNEPVGTNYANLTDPADDDTDPDSYANDAQINFAHWEALLIKYNSIRQDCICNSDCACNLVCSCHNNCGCNYG